MKRLTRFAFGFRINEEVIIRLKWGQTEYKGQLISVDSYMNVQLNSTEEFINGKSTGTLGQVLIRYAIKGLARSVELTERTGEKSRYCDERNMANWYPLDATTSCGFQQPKAWR